LDGPGRACACILPVFLGILTADSGGSLPCLCTVKFPHCKHFNDLSRFPRSSLRTRRQKKPLTQLMHLVSRKAMQNYSRAANPPNIPVKKSII